MRKLNLPFALTIAFVEPNDADARWFELTLREAGLSAKTVHYSSCVSAVDDWSERGHCPFDAVVVADLLPMLKTQDVIDVALTLNPQLRVIMLGEAIDVGRRCSGCFEYYTKPLSAADIRRMFGPSVLMAG